MCQNASLAEFCITPNLNVSKQLTRFQDPISRTRAHRANRMRMGGVEGLRFDDITTFLAVHRARSISSAARQLRVTPSQVSKAVARLERFVGAPLLCRTPRGVTASMAGLSAIPMLESLTESAARLRAPAGDTARRLRLAVSSTIGSAVAGWFSSRTPLPRYAFLDLDLAAGAALRGDCAFDIALSLEAPLLADSFLQEPAGTIDCAVFANPSLASQLGVPPVSADALRKVPFVARVSLNDGRVELRHDACPIPYEARTLGDFASSFDIALSITLHSNQLLFAPRVATESSVIRRELVEIPVRDWTVRTPVYLAFHETRVRASTAKEVRSSVREWLQSESRSEHSGDRHAVGC
jgi:DNA-binding transcriptional LysR family regulator